MTDDLRQRVETARDDTLTTFEAQLRDAFTRALADGPADLDTLVGAALAVLDDHACERYAQQVADETHLMALDFRGGMHMELNPAQDMVAIWCGAARGFLDGAPNYSETPIEMDVKVGESPEQFTFTLQRKGFGKLTPHEARLRAEARVAELEAELARLRSADDDVWIADHAYEGTPGPGNRCTAKMCDLDACGGLMEQHDLRDEEA